MATVDFDLLVDTFKTAWHAADDAGEVGHRTEAGIAAVYDLIEDTVRSVIDTESVRIRYDADVAGEFLGVSHLENVLDQMAPKDEVS